MAARPRRKKRPRPAAPAAAIAAVHAAGRRARRRPPTVAEAIAAIQAARARGPGSSGRAASMGRPPPPAPLPPASPAPVQRIVLPGETLAARALAFYRQQRRTFEDVLDRDRKPVLSKKTGKPLRVRLTPKIQKTHPRVGDFQIKALESKGYGSTRESRRLLDEGRIEELIHTIGTIASELKRKYPRGNLRVQFQVYAYGGFVGSPGKRFWVDTNTPNALAQQYLTTDDHGDVAGLLAQARTVLEDALREGEARHFATIVDSFYVRSYRMRSIEEIHRRAREGVKSRKTAIAAKRLQGLLAPLAAARTIVVRTSTDAGHAHELAIPPAAWTGAPTALTTTAAGRGPHTHPVTIPPLAPGGLADLRTGRAAGHTHALTIVRPKGEKG